MLPCGSQLLRPQWARASETARPTGPSYRTQYFKPIAKPSDAGLVSNVGAQFQDIQTGEWNEMMGGRCNFDVVGTPHWRGSRRGCKRRLEDVGST